VRGLASVTRRHGALHTTHPLKTASSEQKQLLLQRSFQASVQAGVRNVMTITMRGQIGASSIAVCPSLSLEVFNVQGESVLRGRSQASVHIFSRLLRPHCHWRWSAWAASQVRLLPAPWKPSQVPGILHSNVLPTLKRLAD
jgi:hypothetical protein